MSSNYEYKGVINKRDLRKVFLHAITMEHTWNYERMMNDGYMYSMLPALQKIYTDPEDLKDACKRHLEFFNTTPQCITLPLGISVAMEEQRANDMENFDTTSISSVKTAIMGPLAGIGDSFIWGTLRILATGVGTSLALQGSILGPIILLLAFNIPNFLTRYYCLKIGYANGTNLLSKLNDSESMKLFTYVAGIVGVASIGCMIASWVSITTPISFAISGSEIVVQDYLNEICPQLLPLVTTLLIYAQLKKNKLSIMKLIVLIVVVSFVLGALGIIGL